MKRRWILRGALLLLAACYQSHSVENSAPDASLDTRGLDALPDTHPLDAPPEPDAPGCDAERRLLHRTGGFGLDYELASDADGVVVIGVERNTLTLSTYDWEGTPRESDVEVVRIEPTRVILRAAVALTDDGAYVFWIERDLFIRYAQVRGGVVERPEATGIIAENAAMLAVTLDAGRLRLSYASASGPTLAWLEDGRVLREERITEEEPPWQWAAEMNGRESLVVSVAGTDGTTGIARYNGTLFPLFEIPTNANISPNDSPVAFVDGVGFAAVSLIDDSRLYRFGDRMRTIPLGTDYPTHISIVAGQGGGSGGFILAGGTNLGVPYPTVLSSRELRADGTLGAPSVLLDVEDVSPLDTSPCNITRWEAVRGPGGDVITWNTWCEGSSVWLFPRCS